MRSSLTAGELGPSTKSIEYENQLLLFLLLHKLPFPPPLPVLRRNKRIHLLKLVTFSFVRNC